MPDARFMRTEVVSIGSELLLGQIVDTNAAFIARHLAAIGLDLFQSDRRGRPGPGSRRPGDSAQTCRRRNHARRAGSDG